MTELRPTLPADLPALAELYRRGFGHPLSAEEWEWKYRRLPGEARSLVAVDGGGRPLAHAGALRLPARWRGGEGGIWQLADFVGSPRGGGLRPPLVALGRRLLADLPGAGDAPWIFGFPSRRHFRLGERVFGYRPLARFRELPGPLAAAAVAGPGARIETSDRPWEGVEAVWEACGTLGVRRSRELLSWRYWARPGRYYRFYRLLAGGAGSAEVEGLAVFAFVGEEARAAELWLPAAGGDWREALAAVAADLAASGLLRWRFWPPPAGSPAATALAGLGLGAGEEVFIGCRGAVGGDDPRPAAAGFHYAMGDYDLT